MDWPSKIIILHVQNIKGKQIKPLYKCYTEMNLNQVVTGELCSSQAHGHVLSGMAALWFQTVFSIGKIALKCDF